MSTDIRLSKVKLSKIIRFCEFVGVLLDKFLDLLQWMVLLKDGTIQIHQFVYFEKKIWMILLEL